MTSPWWLLFQTALIFYLIARKEHYKERSATLKALLERRETQHNCEVEALNKRLKKAEKDAAIDLSKLLFARYFQANNKPHLLSIQELPRHIPSDEELARGWWQ